MLFWEGIKSDIQKYVAKCEICQQMKYEAMSLVGFLQPLHFRLSESCQCEHYMVVVDRLTKYCYFVALRHFFTVEEVAQKFVNEVIR